MKHPMKSTPAEGGQVRPVREVADTPHVNSPASGGPKPEKARKSKDGPPSDVYPC
jgi:hypothetical protein